MIYLFVFLRFLSAAPAPVHYPTVSETFGKVLIRTGALDAGKATKNQWLTTSATIRTDSGAYVKVLLDQNSSIAIGPDSVVELPSISETSEVERIRLSSGQLRYQESVGHPRTLETQISQGVYINGDYVLSYATGRVELTNSTSNSWS